MLRKIPLFLVAIFVYSIATAQYTVSPKITEMQWDKGFGVRLKLSNDSNYVFDIKELYHATSKSHQNHDQVIYYPVGFGQDFIEQLKEKEIEDSVQNKQNKSKNTTLWSAIHHSIGGNYVHFVNCMLYALETGMLKVDAQLLKRPITKWKPKPMTESYRRTKKWEYYVPTTQKDAIKEYKIKKKKGELRDLQSVPEDFIKLFLSTNDKQYEELSKSYRVKDKAKIDLIRILVASNYLGEVPIDYIRNAVISAVTRYSSNQLPSVIIMEDFNAAVAMTLDENGYKVEKVVFNDAENLSQEEENARKDKITAVIHSINEINRQIFQKSLQNYYKR
ncbi:MAG: hypothetical protein ACOX0M_02605 [Salinivirgaceae bacterium]|jgi:hypothetical protein|nr:hypothetical protein [Bacteroidales bacterium]